MINDCEEQDPKDCDKCNRCKAGYYNNRASLNECLPCLKKLQAAAEGAKFLPNCITAVCAGPSDVKCDNCGSGFFIKTDGSCTPCQSCREGEKLLKSCTGKANKDDKNCQKCLPNTFSAVKNSPKCDACPDTSVTKADAYATSRQSCVCEAGFSISNQRCTECIADTYMSESSTVYTNKVCMECPKHSTTNQQTKVVSVGQCLCKPGYFFSKRGGTDAPHTCSICAPNTYKSTLANDKCIDCPVHSVTKASSLPFVSIDQCKCKTGFGATGVGQPCSRCEKHYYKSTIASKPCTACPDKSTTSTTGSTSLQDCKCLKGYARVNNKCQACPAGKYADTRDQPQCLSCPAGSTTKRKDTVRGWEIIDRATQLSDCVCEPGYRKKNITSTSHICIVCTINEYSEKENSAKCSRCPSRTRARKNASTTWSQCFCIEGRTGQVRSSGSKCSRCRPGLFKDSLGSQKCEWCEENTATESPHFTSDKCMCKAGYMLDPSSDKKCRACFVNTYKSTLGDTSTCTSCPDLTSTAGVTGAINVDACTCNPGYYASTSGSCIECPVNTYKDRPGNGECQQCTSTRKHSSSKNKTQRKSVDGCLCDVGFFLHQSNCRACGAREFIPNCLECEPRSGDAKKVSNKAAVCTKAPVGYTINEAADQVTPNKCTGAFKFGDEVFPDELDITHCLENAIVQPVTGSLCQPLCKPDYKTVKPLPKWESYDSSYCGIVQNKDLKIDYKKSVNASTCRQYCELLPDCYFFVEYTEEGGCAIWHANKRCKVVSGEPRGNEWASRWHAYDGISSDGFKFVCDKDGVWNAQKLTNKQSAVAFFQRQCEPKPITTTSTTTTQRLKLIEATEDPNPPQPLNLVMIIVIAVVVLAILVVVVIIVVVVIRRQGLERKETTVVSEEELSQVFEKTDDPEDGNNAEKRKSWMDSEVPVTFDGKDDLPT